MRFKREAAAGAALLDRETPGWAERVDVDALDLKSCSVCVLGQLFEDFTAGTQFLDLWDDDEVADHGFDLREIYYYRAQGEARRVSGLRVSGLEEDFSTERRRRYMEVLDEKMAHHWDDLRRAWVEQIKRRRE